MPPVSNHRDVQMDSNPSRDDADGLRTVCRSLRFRPYRLAHRQLRLAMARVLQHCVPQPPADACRSGVLAGELAALLDHYLAHQAAEEHCLHAPLRAVAPRALLAFDAEHEEQLAAIGALRALLRELRPDASPGDGAAAELELRLSQFIAEALAHMADEEASLTRALWQHFSDQQLREFAARLDAATAAPPAAAPVATDSSPPHRGNDSAAKDTT